MNPLSRLIPWVLAVVALIALGWWGGWHFGAGRWKSQYTALQAQGLAQRLQAEQAARTAIQAQLEAAHTNLAHNAQVLNELEQKNAAIAADRDHTRDLVQRLLAEAARSGSRRDPLPESGGGPPAAGAGGTTGDAQLEGLLVAASQECERNANRLDSIVEELKPQL